MKAFALAALLAILADAALAQSRPSTLSMSCHGAAGLVAARGAIVLGTGRHTYDRFVRDRSFCQYDEITEPIWVPTADRRQCFIGYRCEQNFDRFFD